jgi:MerR family transcriptional regulator, mercuric resistance operon regulatory protein
MLIGQVAAQAGVHVQTVRYYERRGLLKKPSRLSSGYRTYSNSEIEIIAFIKQTQKLGFTLDEIEPVLRMRSGRVGDVEEIRALCQSKLSRIDTQINALRQMRRELQRVLNDCDCGPGQTQCKALLGAKNDVSTNAKKRTST